MGVDQDNNEFDFEEEIIISTNYLKKNMNFSEMQNSYDEEIIESMLNVIKKY